VADELRQRLIIELNGPGNLPKTLSDSARQARVAEAGLVKVRREVGEASRAAKEFARLVSGGFLSQKLPDENAAAKAAKQMEEARKKRQQLYKEGTTASLGLFAAGAATMRGTVGQYAPAAADRFDWALKDFGASIGRDLQPNLEKATKWVYELGNAYLSLSPGTRKAIADTIFYGTLLAGGVVVYKSLAFVIGGTYTATRGLVAGLGQLAGALGISTVAAQRAAVANVAAGGSSGMLAAGAAGGLLARGGRLALRAGLPAWLAYEGLNLFGDKGDEFGGLGDKLVGSASRTVEATFRKIFNSRARFQEWRARASLTESVKWGNASPEQIARYQKMNETDEQKKDAFGMAARPGQIFGGAQDMLRQMQLDIIQSGRIDSQRELTQALEKLTAAITESLKKGGLPGLLTDVAQNAGGLFGGILGAIGNMNGRGAGGG
jgi:hypothetical protein